MSINWDGNVSSKYELRICRGSVCTSNISKMISVYTVRVAPGVEEYTFQIRELNGCGAGLFSNKLEIDLRKPENAPRRPITPPFAVVQELVVEEVAPVGKLESVISDCAVKFTWSWGN